MIFCAKCYVIHILLDRIKSNQITLLLQNRRSAEVLKNTPFSAKYVTWVLPPSVPECPRTPLGLLYIIFTRVTSDIFIGFHFDREQNAYYLCKSNTFFYMVSCNICIYYYMLSPPPPPPPPLPVCGLSARRRRSGVRGVNGNSRPLHYNIDR